MTLKRKRSTSTKVSKTKHRKVMNGSSLRKSSNGKGLGDPKSGSKMNSKVINTNDLTGSENSRSIVSQESGVVLPSEEEEEVCQSNIFFDQVRQRLSQNSDDGLQEEDGSFLDNEEENLNSQEDKSDTEEDASDESELSSRHEVLDELEEEPEEENFDLDGTPRNHDTSVVSSITHGTNKYHQAGRTYEDLLAMLQEKDKAIKKLAYQINGDDFNAVEFSCSQEKTVIETTKKFIFPCQQFLRNIDVLNDFSSRGSLGKVLMDKLDIPFCQRQAFWFTYKNSVRKGIKQQRCIAHNALKEKFLGK